MARSLRLNWAAPETVAHPSGRELYRVAVSITNAVNIPAELFLVRANLGTYEFSSVCTPQQLDNFNVWPNEPVSGTHYRRANFEMGIGTAAAAAAFRDQVIARLERLLADLAYLDQLVSKYYTLSAADDGAITVVGPTGP